MNVLRKIAPFLVLLSVMVSSIIAGIFLSKGNYRVMSIFLFLAAYSTIIAVRSWRSRLSGVVKISQENAKEVAIKSDSPVRKILCSVKIKSGDKVKEIWCVADTGFTGWLSIDSSVAQELGLEKSGEADVTSSNSNYKADLHFADVAVGKSIFKNVPIQSHKYPSSQEMGLIGIQMLSQGKFSIEKEGDKFIYRIDL